MQEKSLIKIEKFNIFQKISRFFKSLFYKEKIHNVYIEPEIHKEPNMIDELKRKRDILILQQNYETGRILEDDISDDDKREILELYKEQIKTLKDNVVAHKNSLKNYKQKILVIRGKIEESN